MAKMPANRCTAKEPDINAQLHEMAVDVMEYDRTGTLRVDLHCPDCGLKLTYTTHAVIENG